MRREEIGGKIDLNRVNLDWDGGTQRTPVPLMRCTMSLSQTQTDKPRSLTLEVTMTNILTNCPEAPFSEQNMIGLTQSRLCYQ